MAPTPPVKLIMKNECDTSRSTGAVPKQTTATSPSPVSTNTSSSSASRSVSNRARNSSLIKQQQEKREREREKELTSPLQCGTYKALYVSLRRKFLDDIPNCLYINNIFIYIYSVGFLFILIERTFNVHVAMTPIR